MRVYLNPFCRVVIAIVVVACSVSSVAQDDALAAIKAALPGELINDPLATKWNTSSKNFALKSISAPIIGGAAVSAKVKRKPAKPWEASINSPLSRDIEKGETLEIYFWARTKKPAKNSTTGKLAVSVGRSVEPYDSVINQTISPDGEWQLYNAKGVAKAGFPARNARMSFNFGFDKQTIEIGQVYLVSLGTKQALAKPQKTPQKASGIIAGQTKNTFKFAYGDGVSSKQVNVDIPGGKALQVNVGQQVGNTWDAAAGADKLGLDINQGDKVVFEFWARSVSESGKLTAIVQRAEAPYTPVANKMVTLTPDWKKFKVEGTANFALANGQAGVTVHLGHQAQVVELGQFEVSVIQ